MDTPGFTRGEKRSWANLDALAAEIGAHWPTGVSAAIAQDGAAILQST